MLDEFYYLSKYVNISYTDFLKIPTFERKYLINKLVEDMTPKD